MIAPGGDIKNKQKRITMSRYYRIWDADAGRYLATGLNARTLQEVTDDFMEFDCQLVEDKEYFQSASIAQRIAWMESCMYRIEWSSRKFLDEE